MKISFVTFPEAVKNAKLLKTSEIKGKNCALPKYKQIYSLKKGKRFTIKGCKDIWINKSEFVERLNSLECSIISWTPLDFTNPGCGVEGGAELSPVAPSLNTPPPLPFLSPRKQYPGCILWILYFKKITYSKSLFFI